MFCWPCIPCINVFKWSQLSAHYLLVHLFQLLYMFRAAMCPSSGEFTVSMRHWYFCTLYVWLSGLQIYRQRGDQDKCLFTPDLCRDSWWTTVVINKNATKRFAKHLIWNSQIWRRCETLCVCVCVCVRRIKHKDTCANGNYMANRLQNYCCYY